AGLRVALACGLARLATPRLRRAALAGKGIARRQDDSAARRAGPGRHDSIPALRAASRRAGSSRRARSPAAACPVAVERARRRENLRTERAVAALRFPLSAA